MNSRQASLEPLEESTGVDEDHRHVSGSTVILGKVLFDAFLLRDLHRLPHPPPQAQLIHIIPVETHAEKERGKGGGVNNPRPTTRNPRHASATHLEIVRLGIPRLRT